MFGRDTFKTLLAASALALMAGGASAATLNFTGATSQGGGEYSDGILKFDDLRIVNSGGNCDSLSGAPCAALNNNEDSLLTRIGGGTFTLTSIFYDTQGQNAVLSLLTNFGFELLLQDTGGQTAILGSQFANVTSVFFRFTDNDERGQGGNVRFDDIGYSTPAAIPLPAAGFLLIGALGGLAALRRRRRAV